MSRDDVEIAGLNHGEKVSLYQVDEPENSILAHEDDLVTDPDAIGECEE